MKIFQDLFGGEPESQPPPSDSPPELAAELIEAETLAQEMVDYLFSDRLFWQIVVETPLGTRRPKMTLGGQYERIQHLASAEELGPNDRRRVQALADAFEADRRRYPEQFKAKLLRELNSYLHNWRYYLDQRRRDPGRWQEEYEVEVRNRRRVELLARLLGPDAPPGLLDDLDAWEEDA